MGHPNSVVAAASVAHAVFTSNVGNVVVVVVVEGELLGLPVPSPGVEGVGVPGGRVARAHPGPNPGKGGCRRPSTARRACSTASPDTQVGPAAYPDVLVAPDVDPWWLFVVVPEMEVRWAS